MHNNNVVHGDLKPENILIDSTGHLKLTDFGLSKGGNMTRHKKWFVNYLNDKSSGRQTENNGENKKGFIGTPYYVSPELILSQETTPDADWWALGVIIYEMLLGEPPFDGNCPDDIFYAILTNSRPTDIPAGYDDDQITPEAISLINGLLNPDPNKRLGHKGVSEIKNHDFFRGLSWNNLRSNEPPFIPNPTDITDISYFLEKKRFDAEKIESVENKGIHKVRLYKQ